MFFAAGLYGAGLTIYYLGWGASAGFLAGIVAGRAFALAVGAGGAAHHRRRLHDRDHDVRAGRLPARPSISATGRAGTKVSRYPAARAPHRRLQLDLADPTDALQSRAAASSPRACVDFRRSCARPSGACSSRSARTRSAPRCSATTPFATSSSRWSSPARSAAAAGAAYALLFAYVGSTFASIQYSIFPLLWMLLGGAGRRSGRSSARC